MCTFTCLHGKINGKLCFSVLLCGYVFGTESEEKELITDAFSAEETLNCQTETLSLNVPAERIDSNLRRPFAPGGQSTQMIIGATGETDLQLIRTSQSLYQSFDLKRVFYSAYIPLNEDSALPALDTPVPLLREHRLYQADWLLRYYGFQADELLTEKQPFFDSRIDPKCSWAVQHLDRFPVEINRAGYDELLRVPGIGPTGVKRIMEARRFGSVTFEIDIYKIKSANCKC